MNTIMQKVLLHEDCWERKNSKLDNKFFSY